MDRFRRNILLSFILFLFPTVSLSAFDLDTVSLDMIKEWMDKETKVREVFPVPSDLKRSTDFWIKIF